MKFKQKIIKNLIILIGGLVLASVFLFCQNSAAYDSQTMHPDLTREIIDFYELSFDKKLTDEQRQWIISGSIEEDRAPRWLNHFYDPVFKRGLTTSIFGVNGYQSKDWARFSSYQTRSVANISTWWGDFSYEAAVKSYSENKEKDAYIALGHILHLVEDMTVPEHTRNDMHFNDSLTMQSFYENWAMRNSNGLTQDLAKRLLVKGNKPVIYSGLETYFNNLANYSNNYFFSPRTINSEIYLKPKIVYEDGTFAYGKDENGELFDLVIIETYNPMNRTYTYNLKSNQILQEYWLRLSRQAVINGAGVIQLFLNQGELAKAEFNKTNPQKGSLLSQIYGFFAGLFGQKSEPALVITSEPEPQSPQSPQPKIKPAVQSITTPAPVAVSPVPKPAPTSSAPASTTIPVSAPVSQPQVSAPVVYGGGGGGSSSNISTPNQEQSSGTGQAFQAGDLVINEIMYSLAGSDPNHEWVEIYNNSGRAITLTGSNSGWRFNDGSNHLLNESETVGSMTISAGGYAILSASTTVFLSDHSGFSGAVIDTAMSLKNSTSTIKIISPTETTIDEVTYYNSWGADGDGKTLERKSASGNSNNPDNWAESSVAGGTPGAANNWESPTISETIPVATSSVSEITGLGTDISATTTIAENATWTLAGSPYRLFFDGQRRPTVAAGATLTITPGVKIIPQGGNYTALEIQGTLIATATSGAPIIFTSNTPQAGEWLNIAFSRGSQGNLDYVEFRYGGQGIERPIREMIKAVSATININHSKFESAQGIALRLVDSNGVIENSIFSDNACGISVDSLVNGDGATDGGCAGSSGYFPAAATTTPQIRNNQFIRNRIIAVETRNGATPILDGNLFIDNGYPIRIESSYPSIANSRLENSTTSPNILGGIAIDGYTHFRRDYTLKKDLPYILETNGPSISPYIESGATLTIEPGTILKTDNTNSALFVYGTLIASTTPDNPIVFTSLKDNGSWGNIKFLTGSIGSFVNTIFSYGGYGYIAPPPPSPVELFTENFDSYSLGALSYQGDWGSGNPSGEISIVNSFSHDGSNSVYLSGGGGGAYTYRTLTQPITENGVLSFWLYYNSLGNQGVSITSNQGRAVASIYYDVGNNNCSTSDGSCFVLDNIRTTIQTTAGAWHHIEVETDFAIPQARMRQDDGEWSNWISNLGMNGWVGANIARIRLDRGTGDVFFDTFVYSKQASDIPANPALSIDSGATVNYRF